MQTYFLIFPSLNTTHIFFDFGFLQQAVRRAEDVMTGVLQADKLSALATVPDRREPAERCSWLQEGVLINKMYES